MRRGEAFLVFLQLLSGPWPGLRSGNIFWIKTGDEVITRQQDSTTVTEAETQLTRAGTGGDWSGGVSQLLASLELIILIKSTTTTASSLHRQTVLRDMLRLSVLPQKHCLMSGGNKNNHNQSLIQCSNPIPSVLCHWTEHGVQ